jgi:hypothetical protein
MINFDYDLDEIVQMAGMRSVPLRTALLQMPGRVDPVSMLHRKPGKRPPFFDAGQIQALLDRHLVALQAGKPLGHRVADRTTSKANRDGQSGKAKAISVDLTE